MAFAIHLRKTGLTISIPLVWFKSSEKSPGIPATHDLILNWPPMPSPNWKPLSRNSARSSPWWGKRAGMKYRIALHRSEEGFRVSVPGLRAIDGWTADPVH
jgi:hypothetical protein